MTRISILMLVIVMLFGCNKDDNMDIKKENILGTWTEEYSNYPYYTSEGGAIYTFLSDNKVQIHYYDVFAGDHDVTKTYVIGGNNGEDVIVLYAQDENMSDTWHQYRIVKLTKKEMEWQKVGTQFTQGTVGAEFKHFVRK